MIDKRTLTTFFLSLIVMLAALAGAKSLLAATCTGADRVMHAKTSSTANTVRNRAERAESVSAVDGKS